MSSFRSYGVRDKSRLEEFEDEFNILYNENEDLKKALCAKSTDFDDLQEEVNGADERIAELEDRVKELEIALAEAYLTSESDYAPLHTDNDQARSA